MLRKSSKKEAVSASSGRMSLDDGGVLSDGLGLGVRLHMSARSLAFLMTLSTSLSVTLWMEVAGLVWVDDMGEIHVNV